MTTESLQEFPIEEMQTVFTREAIVEISQFQSEPIDSKGQNPIERILNEQLFPKNVIQQYGREVLLGMLACNTATYDEIDDIENTISQDTLIQELVQAKENDPLNINAYTRALRVRRSVIAFLQSTAPSFEVVSMPVEKSPASPSAA